MRALYILLLLMAAATVSQAQKVHVYGQATGGGKPIKGVLIMIFEQDRFYKRFVTSVKGEFQFFVGYKDYFILFYKPGMMPEAYHIINNSDANLMMIPINMELKPAERNPDSVLVHAPLLSYSNPEIVKAYIAAVYDYEKTRKDARNDTTSVKTRNTLIRKALEERQRFSQYKKTTVSSSGKDSSSKTTIVIGPDTYDMVTDARGAKKYYKNDKPVTETTYVFETTRRYDGVLKNKRDVRRFEKYHPMEHVRGK